MKLMEMLGIYDVLGFRKRLRKVEFTDEQSDLIVAEFQKFYIFAILVVPTFMLILIVALSLGISLLFKV